MSFIFQHSPFGCSFSIDIGSKLHEGQAHLGVKLSFRSVATKYSGSVWWMNEWVWYTMSSSLTWGTLKAAVKGILLLCYCWRYLPFSAPHMPRSGFQGSPLAYQVGIFAFVPARDYLSAFHFSPFTLVRTFLFLLDLTPIPPPVIFHPPCRHTMLFWGSSPGCFLVVDIQGGLCTRQQIQVGKDSIGNAIVIVDSSLLGRPCSRQMSLPPAALFWTPVCQFFS